METVIKSQSVQSAYEIQQRSETATSVWSTFMNWCAGQENFRFGWVGISIASHGCILTPLTIFAIMLSGASLVLFVIALATMGMVLVANLAAMPTKITLPIFIASIVIDIVLIVVCMVHGFDISGTYI